MKRTAFWLITILFPFVLLLLLEAGLRLAGFNAQARNLFIELPHRPGYLVTNPDFVNRYFPAFSPEFAINPFREEKAPDTFRLFVLGGSSAQGFPYHSYHSFAGSLDQQLLMKTQDLNIEVINLGMTAVNSYVIWDLSHRITEYQPDAVIIYAGHNEYYGSFGVASTQFGFGQGVFTKRLILRLKNWSLFQLMENLLRPASPGSGGRTMMAEVVKESAIELNSPLYEAGIEQFQKNISEVLAHFSKHEVPVYMGTVASNLKDQPPFGEQEGALHRYEEAGRLLDKNETGAARSSFLKAKELDGIRFRAPEAINTVIQDLARTYDTEVADVKQLSADSSLSGIPDNSFFVDHLHPNWRGNQLIAGLFFEKLKTHPVIARHYLPNPLAVGMPLSRFEETYSAIPVLRLKSAYPFTKGRSPEEEEQAFQKAYREYMNRSFVDSLAASAWMDRSPVPEALRNAINFYSRRGDTLSVARHYLAFVHWQGINDALLERGIDYLMQNRKMDRYSAALLHHVLNKQSHDPYFYNTITSVYLINGDLERGEYWLKESEQRNARSPHLFYNYARYYTMKGENEKAREYYRQYLDARNQ